MTTRLDLREAGNGSHRDRVFETLDAVEPGETVEVVAERDPEVALYRYRIKRPDVDVDWAYERDGPDEWVLSVTKGPRDAAALPAFDVRGLVPRRRHEVLLETFDDLEPGEGFVLVNDHDPKPLYHELRSTRGDTFEWAYERRESDEWRVAIEKTEPSEATPADVITRFDVREIPKPERHPTIHHRFGMIPEGETMEIVAPHEPRHLRQEFRQRYGDGYTWEIVEQEPGRCRVHVTKGGEAENGTDVTAEDIQVTTELDVRDRPPAARHEAIFRAYDELDADEGFVLVNDHDPRPLYHQFQAEVGDALHWAYRQRDPGEFRVLIGRTDDDGGTTPSDDTNAEAPF